MARDVRNLAVFRCADALLFEVLATSATLRGNERFILGDQLRRAALSVPLNLVEGSQRTSTKEYGRFVEIAAGSAAETGYLLSVASRLVVDDLPFRRLAADYEALVRRLEALRSRLASLAAAER